jgi:hypothetical protein
MVGSCEGFGMDQTVQVIEQMDGRDNGPHVAPNVSEVGFNIGDWGGLDFIE